MTSVAGRRGRMSASRFFCICCGQEGMPVWRRRKREPGHLKSLYCIHCRMRLNHFEARNEAEARKFLADFEAGVYREAAEETIRYAREQEKRKGP